MKSNLCLAVHYAFSCVTILGIHIFLYYLIIFILFTYVWGAIHPQYIYISAVDFLLSFLNEATS